MKAGNQVEHNAYGHGVVIKSVGVGDDQKVTVDFEQHGTKTLAVKYANLVVLTDETPPQPTKGPLLDALDDWQEKHTGGPKPLRNHSVIIPTQNKDKKMMSNENKEICKCGRPLHHTGRHRGGLSPQQKVESSKVVTPTLTSKNVKRVFNSTYASMLTELKNCKEKLRLELTKIDAAIAAFEALVKE